MPWAKAVDRLGKSRAQGCGKEGERCGAGPVALSPLCKILWTVCPPLPGSEKDAPLRSARLVEQMYCAPPKGHGCALRKTGSAQTVP